MKKEHLINSLKYVYNFYRETPSLFIIIIIPVVEMTSKYFGFAPHTSPVLYKLLAIIYLFGAMTFMFKMMREKNKIHEEKMDSYRDVNEQLEEARVRNDESYEVYKRAMEMRDEAVKNNEDALKIKAEAIENLEKSKRILEALKTDPANQDKMAAIVEEVAKVM